MDMTLFCRDYTLMVDFKEFLSCFPTFRVPIFERRIVATLFVFGI